ncbi:hypothetical protein DFH07DRAFT_856498 [Mycena maculata]|uniref:Uncharacterized protein n=1 Tax=Mycena maculata TaxID=230809 RepID=A0AAD7HLS2_9AGAR|nr:hypothetical protein DFH07DRAFT_856498 [Mycena maculata]
MVLVQACCTFPSNMELSPSGEKALKAFEDGGRKSVDCRMLLQDTFETFSMLERWEVAESKVDSVMSVIHRVRQQGRAYFETLDDSISVAITLNELAQDAKHLARSLLDPDHKTEEIQEFVAEMRSYTGEALNKSQRVSEALRTVRKGINQISGSIPDEMEKLERQEEKIVAKKETLERRVDYARIGKTVSTAGLAIVGGVSSLVFPPLLLILPVGLPIGILVLEAYEHRIQKRLRKREEEILDCRNGLDQLQEIATFLAGFTHHVDALTDFWVRSDTMLETISNGVRRIRGNTARLRLQAILDRWEETADLYFDYAAKLQMIQKIECGATSSLRSKTSSASGGERSPGSDKGSHQSRREKSSVDLKRQRAIKSSSRSASKGSSGSRHSSH